MGTGPVFGFPPICYSPPGDMKKTDPKRDYLSVLMKHVFQRPENLASVKDIIDAQEAEEEMMLQL